MRCESDVQSLMLLLMCLVKHTGSGASLQSTDVICRVVQGPMGLPGDNITCLQLKRFERPQLQLACMVTADFELFAPGGGLPPMSRLGQSLRLCAAGSDHSMCSR